MRNKLIFIDYQVFVHKAGHASRHNPGIPVSYSILNMIFSTLCKIGVDDCTTIVLGNDAGKSWRRKKEQTYKSDRKAKKEQSGLDWDEIYKQANWLYQRLIDCTDWQECQYYWLEYDEVAQRERRWGLEADDLAALLPKYFKETDIIIVSVDADLEQLFIYNYDQHDRKVYIYSPRKKSDAPYKKILSKEELFKLTSKKLEKETSDNLTAEVQTDEDYERREEIVKLTDLPKWIEDIAFNIFSKFEQKETDYDGIPFKSIRARWNDMYKTDKVITYEQSIALEEKREARKKKIKDKEKAILKQAKKETRLKAKTEKSKESQNVG